MIQTNKCLRGRIIDSSKIPNRLKNESKNLNEIVNICHHTTSIMSSHLHSRAIWALLNEIINELYFLQAFLPLL